MLSPGTAVEMTKGYRGTRGVIERRTESAFEFYVLKLDNDIHLVAGPTAFLVLKKEEAQGRTD
jgi:hypothetical protein